jgi:hypothetical protein
MRLDPKDYTTEQIREAALTFVTDYPLNSYRGKWAEGLFICLGLYKVFEPEHYAATRGQWPGDRFYGKVKRVLDKMAAEGALIKKSGGNKAFYATPAYAAECAGAEAAQVFEAEAGDDRFKRLVKRAAQSGFEIGGNRHQIHLSLDDMDRLLSIVEETEELRSEPWR